MRDGYYIVNNVLDECCFLNNDIESGSTFAEGYTLTVMNCIIDEIKIINQEYNLVVFLNNTFLARTIGISFWSTYKCQTENQNNYNIQETCDDFQNLKIHLLRSHVIDAAFLFYNL